VSATLLILETLVTSVSSKTKLIDEFNPTLGYNSTVSEI